MLWVSFFKFTLELHCRCLSVPFLTFHRRASHEKDDPKAGSKGSPEVDRDAQSRTLRTCQSFRRWQACKIHWATWCNLEVLKSDVFLGVRKQQHPLCFSRVSLISKKVFWGYSPNMFLSNAFVALSCYECLFATSSQVFLWSKLQYTSGVSLLVSSNADPEVNCREKPSMFFTTSQYSLNRIQFRQAHANKTWVVVSCFCTFHPYLGKIPNLTHTFLNGFKPPTRNLFNF